MTRTETALFLAGSLCALVALAVMPALDGNDFGMGGFVGAAPVFLTALPLMLGGLLLLAMGAARRVGRHPARVRA